MVVGEGITECLRGLIGGGGLLDNKREGNA